MSDSDLTNRSERSISPSITASRDPTQSDPLNGRMLYVLGFGVAGAILANAIMLIYFVSLYASG
jgi:hypothetical protein